MPRSEVLEALPDASPLLPLLQGADAYFDPRGTLLRGAFGEEGAASVLTALRFAAENAVWLALGAAALALLAAAGWFRRRREQEARLIRRGVEEAEEEIRRGWARKIREKDGRFDEDKFLERASDAFLLVQGAVHAHGLPKARPFVSDGVFSRLKTRAEVDALQNVKRVAEEFRLTDWGVVHAEPDRFFDEIHVKLSGTTIRYATRADTGAFLLGRSSPVEFSEIWTFLRRKGAKTKDGPGAIEGSCPNCGAPLEGALSAKCGHCGSFVNSGEHDWVLTEVSEEHEWHAPRAEGSVPGYREALERDPTLSLAAIEDRASAAFWRTRKAVHAREKAPLVKLSARDALDRLATKLLTYGEGTTSFFQEQVGGVETLKVEPDGALERAHVLVKWRGLAFKRKGERFEALGPMWRHSVLTLKRRAGDRSRLERSFTSMHCAGCGAPFSDGAAEACEYCGGLLNDGLADWALEDVQLYRDWIPKHRGGAPETQGPPPLDPATLIGALVRVMWADGRITPNEQSMLRHYAERRRFPKDKLQELFEAVRHGRLQVDFPSEAEPARAFVAALAEMSLADGRIEAREAKLLEAFGARCGLKRPEVAKVARSVRDAMLSRAKKKG